MQAGQIAIENEGEGKWPSVLVYASREGSGGVQHKVFKGWAAVVAALQLGAGQSICLAARSPTRLLVSRQGEPHFRAAAAQGLLSSPNV